MSGSIRQRKSPFAHVSHAGDERSFKIRRHGDDDALDVEEDIVLEQSEDPVDKQRLQSHIENDLAINRSHLDSTVQQQTPDENSH
jgi:hypothetical protein